MNRYRDRDNAVTTLPILFDAFSYEKRDGRVIRSDGGDFAVRVIPRNAVEAIIDPKRREEINQKFNQAFKTVSEDALTDLKALVFLLQAIEGRSHETLKTYVKWKAPLEAARAEKGISTLLAKLGDTKPRDSDAGKDKYLTNAVRSLLRRTRYPLSEFSRELNAHARLARFVIWWDERSKKFVPGLYCKDMATALAIGLFFRQAGVCLRCKNWFIPTSKKPQRFCSLRCGNADRKARERERDKHRKSKPKAR